MGTAEKFMFDYSFDNEPVATPEPEIDAEQPPEEVEEEVIVPTFSEEDLEISRQQGFEAGKQEGLAATTESLTKQINETLVQVDKKLAVAFQTQGVVNEALSRSALAVARGICGKMLPALAEKHSFDEVDRVISAVFAKILEHPSATITTHSSLAEEIEKRVIELSAGKAYQGKIFFQSDETMQPDDCKVEWFNGGSERDSQAMWRDITSIVDRNIGDDATYWKEPDESANSAATEETEPTGSPDTPEENLSGDVQQPNIED